MSASVQDHPSTSIRHGGLPLTGNTTLMTGTWNRRRENQLSCAQTVRKCLDCEICSAIINCLGFISYWRKYKSTVYKLVTEICVGFCRKITLDAIISSTLYIKIIQYAVSYYSIQP